ncbi:MAG: hypothetical protein U0746_22530 [Gemmataceae bacterium]
MWRSFRVGLLLSFGAIAAYSLQFIGLKWLTVPWYLPILGTVGALIALTSLGQRRAIGRYIGVTVLVLLASAEWLLVAKLSVLPTYAGPGTGQPFPAFAARFADGTPFTEANLKGDKETILIFFRGRW